MCVTSVLQIVLATYFYQEVKQVLMSYELDERTFKARGRKLSLDDESTLRRTMTSATRKYKSYRVRGNDKLKAEIALLFTNFVVIVIANALFIIGMIGRTSFTLKVIMQLALPIFYAAWNRFMDVCVTIIFRGDAASPYRLFFGILIFNLLIAPLVLSTFIDSSCFYYVFTKPDSVTSEITSEICSDWSYGLLFTACTSFDTVAFTTSFTPVFQYYYSCASNSIARHVPSLLLYYFVNGTVIPTFKYLFSEVWTESNLSWKLQFIPLWLQYFIPSFLWSPVIDSEHHHDFPSARIMATTHVNFTMALTVGVLYPPLALVIGVVVMIQTTQHLRYMLNILQRWQNLRG
jgi:hypothetical protein